MTKNIRNVLHKIGDELVVSVDKASDLHGRVYDSSGVRIGKVTRILGPVEAPYGVIKISGKKNAAADDMKAIEIRSGRND